METIPFAEKKPIFNRLKDEARYYKMSQAERDQYDAEVKNHLVYEATISFAEKKAKAEEKLENARNFKKLGVSFTIISQATGLSIEEIEAL